MLVRQAQVGHCLPSPVGRDPMYQYTWTHATYATMTASTKCALTDPEVAAMALLGPMAHE